MDCVWDYLNLVAQEIQWVDCLDEWNHTPHFPFFVTDYLDSVPVGSTGGALSDVLFNPKYVGHIWKVIGAIDSHGNIFWICPYAPGTSADVLRWDCKRPQRTKPFQTL